MPHPNRPGSARVAMHGYACWLYGTPRVVRRDDGTVDCIELGTLPSGRPLTVDPYSLEWLLDVEAVFREAWAAGKVMARKEPQP